MVCIPAVVFSFSSIAVENPKLIYFDPMLLQTGPTFTYSLVDCYLLPDITLCTFIVRSSRRLHGSHGCRPRLVCADSDILSVAKGKIMARSPPRKLQVARRDILCWQEYGVMDVRLLLQSWHGQCSTCLPRFELNIKYPWRHSQSLCLSRPSSLPIA